MLQLSSFSSSLRRRVHIGRRTYSLGALLLIGGVVTLAGGGAVYARLGGTTNPSSSSSIDLQKGLVGWWKMDGDTKDSTPYSAVVTRSGVTTTTDRKGKASGAMSFDGNTDSLTTPDAPQYDSGSVTVSFWLNLSSDPECDASNNWRSLASKTASNSNANAGWDIILEQTKSLHFDIGYGGVTHRSATVNAGIAVGVPILLTFTYDASTGVQNVYGNGVLKSTSTFTATPITANATAVGISNGLNSGCPNTNGHVPGSYDDFRIYNRAISATETTALYNSYDAGVKAASGEGGLVGWWKMDGNLKDSTPNGNNATGTSTTFAADRKATSSSAVSFNGTSSTVLIPSTTKIKPTTAVTVSTWMNAASLTSSTAGALVSTSQSGGYAIRILGNTANVCAAGMLSFSVNVAGTYYATCYARTNFSVGTWYLITGTYDGANLNLYVNGSLVNSVSLTGVMQESNSSTPVCLGAEAQLPTACSLQYFNGSLDDVRIYSRALSQYEIQKQYRQYNSQINLNTSPSSATSVNLGRGLIGYWSLNGDAKDATPYSNNGAVSGATLTTDYKGRASSAYAFVGASNNNIALPSNYNTSTMTVAAWVKSTSNTASETAVSRYTTGSDVDGAWILGMSTVTGRYRFRVVVGGSVLAPSCPTVYTANTWHHLVGTYNGSLAAISIDGTECAFSSLSGSLPNLATNVKIGARSGNDTGWTGSIDDVRIWNRALSVTEVQALYGSYR
jgi:hypothetical protein